MLRECHSSDEFAVPVDRLRNLQTILDRIPSPEVEAMVRQIHREADSAGHKEGDYFASSWGKHDWSEYAGGVFAPLYDAILDERQAALMLGTFIMREISGRGDEWVFSHDPDAGTDACPRNMWGSFYWRANRA
jgi:hypothetical protein